MVSTAAYTRGRKNRFARRKEEQQEMMKRRARRFFRRNLILIALFSGLFIGGFAGVFIGTKVNTYAQSTKINNYGRQLVYTTYTVKSGDTIWSIAQDLAALNPEFNDIRQYVLMIERTNKIMDGQIESGQIILIPYYIGPDGTVSHDELYSKYGIGGQ